MEDKIRMSILCGIYGKLLTEKQYEILNDYYNNDFSLSEIAENNNITRQAVKDVINKSNSKLEEYEEKLSFMRKLIENEKVVKETLDSLEKLKDTTLSQEQINKISKKLQKIVED